MSFDVHLLASTSSPPPGVFEAKVDAVLRTLGANGGVAEEAFRTHDGLEAELYAAGGGGVMFALRGFSPSIAEAIFTVADATSCFILSAAEVATLLRTPANAGDLAMPPEEVAEFPPPLPIADAAALMTIMAGDFDGWSNYRDQIQATPQPKKTSWFGQLFSKS